MKLAFRNKKKNKKSDILGGRHVDERTVRSGVRLNASQSNPVMRYYGGERRSAHADGQQRVSKKRFGRKHTSNDDISNVLQGRAVAPVGRTSPSRGLVQRVSLHIFRWSGALIIIFILLVSLTLSSPTVSLAENQPQRNLFRSVDEYQTGISQLLQRSVAQRTKLSFRSTTLEEKIRIAYPEIQSADIIVPLLGRAPHVKLYFEEPFTRLSMESNQQAIMSRTGRVIFKSSAEQINSRFSDLPLLSMRGLRVDLGTLVLTNQELSLVDLLKQEFDGSDSYRPALKSIEYDVQRREMIVRFEGATFFAKLTPERQSREQVGSLVATLRAREQGSGVVISEYIDVRVDGRVFIK